MGREKRKDDGLRPGKGRYVARYERDEESDAWLVSIVGLPQCHTFGRSLTEARRHIRDALSLWVDDAAKAQIVDDIRLDADAKRALRSLVRTRLRAERTAAELFAQLRDLVKRELAELSTRDAAELLTVSQQRIAQLRGAAAKTAKTKTARPRPKRAKEDARLHG